MSDALPPEVPAGNPWKIVLGIDPGTLVVGYGAVVLRSEGPALLATGVLRASGKAPAATRLGSIRRDLDELIARLKPAVVVVESGFAGVNVQSALRVGEGRGVALACAAAGGAEVVELAPAAVKRSLVGNGAASKEQVARMVAAELGLDDPPRPHDATDALALALTYAHHLRVVPGRL